MSEILVGGEETEHDFHWSKFLGLEQPASEGDVGLEIRLVQVGRTEGVEEGQARGGRDAGVGEYEVCDAGIEVGEERLEVGSSVDESR